MGFCEKEIVVVGSGAGGDVLGAAMSGHKVAGHGAGPAAA
jgi:hypothetical protein